MSKLESATVEITLDGQTKILQPTIAAALAISRPYGGLNKALAAVNAFDLDAHALVAAAGLGLDGKKAEKVAEWVYTAGVLHTLAPLSRYVMVLMNGGRGAEEEPGKEPATGE